jgi:VIT1/CCC1 family predicted Fe2+/Mn2+ transporter
MPQTPHVEEHFTGSATIRDVVIGMADGLTVPFALAAGLSGAVMASGIVITAGLAEVAAGSIAMGLGGYLAARSDAEHFASERRREQREVVELPDRERQEIVDLLGEYGVSPAESASVVKALEARPEKWVDFMMKFELGLEEPDPKRALRSALTIAVSYIIGGLVPLSPYFFAASAAAALLPSVGFTLAALAVFGYVKGRFTGTHPVRSALQTLLVGGLAAGAAYGLAKAIG